MSTEIVAAGEALPARSGPMSAEEADELDRRIHQAIEDTWGLIVEMNDRGGWKALGHPSMAAYLMETLDVKSSQAYRMINRVDVVKAISEAVGDTSPSAQAKIAKAVSAKGAEAVRPVVDDVAAQVAQAVADGADLDDATAEAIKDNRTDRPRPDDVDPLLANLGPGELAAMGLDPELADTGDDDRPARPARQDAGYDDRDPGSGPIGGPRVFYEETEDEIVRGGDGIAEANAALAARTGGQSHAWEGGYDDGYDGEGEDISQIMSGAPGHERTGRQRTGIPRPLPPRPGRKVCPTCEGHADLADTGRD